MVLFTHLTLFHSGLNIFMRFVYVFLSLAPAPLFLLGFIHSILFPGALCISFPYEMAIMWFVMFLAHCTPWILFWQQRNFTRD